MPTKVAPPDLASRLPALLRTTDAWIGHRNKRPVMLPQGRKAARTNVPATWGPFSDAERFYSATHADGAAGVGFVFQRQQGIVFIDFDHCLDKETGALAAWAEPILAPFRGKTFIERSVSGTGLHVLVLGSIDRAYPNVVPPGADRAKKEHLDIYSDLRFVAITGDSYDDAPATLASMQDEVDALLAGLVGKGEEEAGSASVSPGHDELTPAQLETRIEEVTSALTALDPDMAYEEWLHIGMALHHGLGQRGLALWDDWSSRGSKYVKGECRERWASFRRSGVTLGTLFHAANEAGWRSPLDDPKRQFEALEDLPPADPNDAPPDEGGFAEWVGGGYRLWKPNPKQESMVPCFDEANLHRFFMVHPGWKGRLRYNARTLLPERDGVEFDHILSARALAESHAHLGWNKRAFSMRTVQATIQTIAEGDTFDPVADWLQTLVWDSTKRIETLCEHLGIENDPITRRCLTRWLIGAVARAMRPGCKMQNMLVLLGPQGRQKSGLLERLATKQAWFHESHVELKNKEGYVTLDRKWIVEFAELDSLRKVDVEKVKAFISESVSNYRAPFARVALDHPRRFVLAGTANEDRILRDPTGARRFWIIRCPGLLNLSEFTPEFVAQVWAEARHMFENGVRWWDTAAEVDELNVRNEQFYSASAADLMIQEIVEKEFSTHGVLRLSALVDRLMEKHVVQAATSENAIGAVLRRMHWEPGSVRIDDRVFRLWFAPSIPGPNRKEAAVIHLEQWRKNTGQLTPMDDEKKTSNLQSLL